MITPEQIKKLIEVAKPEGFSHRKRLDNMCVIWSCGMGIERDLWHLPTMQDFYIKPLFLQKCIEGINRCNPEYLQIAQCGYSIQVLTDCNREVLLNINLTERNGVSIDQAKEQALIYILDNIQKQD